MYNTPIPGQSLTREPRSYAWEDPPKYSKPEDALMWHMDRLEDPERTKAVLTLLELGLDVVTLTEGILRGGVVQGIHNIDISLIIAPIIHEYIVGTANAVGINFKEGLSEFKVDYKQFESAIDKNKINEVLKDIDEDKPIDLDPIEDVIEQEEPQVEESEVKEKPKGLMAREVLS
tara:strand:- start:4627 stop:5151 length:525 start_codon:yes stop_codon:yes gene_type:complete